MLSAVPLALLLVAGFGLFADDAEVRRRVVTTVLEYIPLSTESDRERLERTLDEALDNSGRIGPVSVLFVIVAASGVMAALRHAINEAWDIDARPPLLRRKALDVALVLTVTAVMLLSASLTWARDAEREYGLFFDIVGDVLPFVFTLGALLFLYRILPMHRPKVREIWPGALLAAVLLTLVRAGLELYFEHLAGLGALYGSLGALMALLVFVFAASNVVVFGAEFAVEWKRSANGA